MLNITFLPVNKSFVPEKGVSILNLAMNKGITIPSQCEEGVCYTCSVEIKKGKELLLEKLEGEEFEISSSAENILACITELKPSVDSGEIIINLSGTLDD